ncbi:MAG: ATPase, T2SS/T4P/T4SS family [Granulosicoccaceae bacterium]
MFRVYYQAEGADRLMFNADEQSCTIGKSRECDIPLKGWRATKHHATIELRDSGLWIVDHGSTTGTWVNKERVVEHGPLHFTDEIVVGTTELTVQVDEAKLQAAKQEIPIQSLGAANTEEVTAPKRKIDPTSQLELKWRQLIHQQLLAQMDLRRKDLHEMNDEAVKAETKQLLDEILYQRRDEIPAEIDKTQLEKAVLDEAVGLGPIEDLIRDDDVTEIMVNRFDEVYVERAGQLTLSDYNFSNDGAVRAVIDRIISPLGRRIDESSPMVDARLKDGSRVNAIIPPLALKGSCLTIRKFAKKRLYAHDLIKFGSMNEEMATFLEFAVRNRKNIIVSGGTGTGKTTLLNVLSNFIPDSDRILTIEDAAELRLSQPDLVSLEARPPNVEGRGAVTIRDLVKNALRMRPDRIIVGECRGGEALDMLQAMNTGHDGSLTTAHANTPRDALSRLQVMVLMAGMDLPIGAIREQITSAVDIIVQQKRFACGARKVTHITEITGIESGNIQMQDIFRFVQDGLDENKRVIGNFAPTGFIPEFCEELNSVGINIDTNLFQKGAPIHV